VKNNEIVKRAAGLASVVLDSLLPNRTENSLGILVYHRIAERIEGIAKPQMNVPPDCFHRQLSGLRQRGFQFCSLQQVLTCREANDVLPAKAVVVTFDDGFENVYRNAWPVLRELEIPATVFVNTAFLDSQAPFPFDPWAREFEDRLPAQWYRPLSRRQCREMLAGGLMDVGAHTHTHRDFRGKPAELRKDLLCCIEVLRSEFGIQEPSFAFPFGRVAWGFAGGVLSEAARQTGVTCALTTECELNDLRRDPFCWGRFNAYDWDTDRTLAAKLDGWYGWAPRLQDRLSGWGRTSPTRLRR